MRGTGVCHETVCRVRCTHAQKALASAPRLPEEAEPFLPERCRWVGCSNARAARMLKLKLFLQRRT